MKDNRLLALLRRRPVLRSRAAALTQQDPKSAAARFEAAIPVGDWHIDRWDREWLLYLDTENVSPYFVQYQDLTVDADLSGMTAEQVCATNLTRRVGRDEPMPHLFIWTTGDQLVNRDILEIGCGPAMLGKQLGLIADSYTGIDYSPLALRIAELTSPPNCTYFHLSELQDICGRAATADTMVGRNFFIHQNFANAHWLLQLAHMLLRPGGSLCADFYLGNPEIRQGVVHPAKSDLDPRYASCAYRFTVEEIRNLADRSGYTVSSVSDQLDLQRRFVEFQKR